MSKKEESLIFNAGHDIFHINKKFGNVDKNILILKIKFLC